MNTSKEPLVSVIIALYNGERYIREAVDSVLAQTYVNFEVIIVDDGSTDNGAAIVKRYDSRVQYKYQNNGGVASALNTGISASTGGLIAFLDHDDVWTNNKLEMQVQVLQKQPEIDLVLGLVEQFICPQIPDVTKSQIFIPKRIAHGYFKGAILIRRQALARIGRFDGQWRVGDFVDWYLRAAEAGIKSYMIEEVVIKRRIHETNMGQTRKNDRGDFARILKASLDRRRAMTKAGSDA